MSMHKKVTLNTHYTRSINLERDADSIDVVRAYIPTSRAIKLFQRIADAFHADLAPRAWSIVGPYGSGKSSSQSFSSHLLANPELDTTKAALDVLKEAAPELAQQFHKQTRNTKGYLRVLITGAPEPMGVRIVQGLAVAAESFWSALKGPNPKVVKQLKEASGQKDLTTTEIVGLIQETQAALVKVDCRGIALVIDELGKFLEYEARHYGADDIYLLQAIAEHACKGSDCNLFLFVLLHQSFEQYAKGLGENLKNEWSKVQGRFEEVPFLESAEQILRVVSAAFSHRLSGEEQVLLGQKICSSVSVLDKHKALPSTLGSEYAVKLFKQCYPLHPVSALLLPMLCQKVAQNERTLFSYLGSHEEYGLLDMLHKLNSVEEQVMPHHLYDYFITNQPAVITDYSTHRRWAEVVTAIERLGDAPAEQVNMLKTVGILNIIGIKGGFKPSKEILEVCASSKRAAKQALAELIDKSIITYRKFSGEYRVWQGSDFDLETAVDEELANVGEFSLAEVLNKEASLLPVVARRYTIKSGALRYFVPEFVDAQNYKKADKQSHDARIIFYLANAQDDEKRFYDDIISYFSDLDLTALILNGMQLREAVAEVLALRRVEANRQELNSDPVAKREFEDRLFAAEQAEQKLLNQLLESPEQSVWYNRSKHLEVESKRQFQEVLSDLLSKIYCYSPVLRNELINRDRPSSQANAARNKLLWAMLNQGGQEDLGIEKFPPEKAIYRSILRETGLHNPGSLEFVEPDPKSTLFPVWQRVNQFLDETENEPKPFTELNDVLMAPPYGVKAGVLPIFYIAAYLVYQYELALYENRRYRPSFEDEMLVRFVKRPDEFTFQRFKISGLRASFYKEYSKLYSSGEAKRTVIQLVKPLAKFVGKLEPYTLKTKSADLSETAKRVRDAFKLPKSPENLMFEVLPKALGFGHASEDPSSVEGMAAKLQESLQELKACYPKMQAHQLKLMLQAFHMDSNATVSEFRKKCARYEGLDQYTVDVDGLKALVKRLTKREGDDETWFEGLQNFLGQKPAAKWSDTDRAEVEVKLSDYAKRLLDLDTLRVQSDRYAEHSNEDFDVILLKTLKKGEEPIDEVVAIDKTQHQAIQATKEALSSILSEHKDKDLQIAALVELVDDFLKQRRQEQSNKGNAKLKVVSSGESDG